MQAVLLAGGLATRMRPFTDKIPKSMLDVAGRPFVDWQLAKIKSCGFDDVVMCIGHLGEQLRDHVEDGARYGLRVRYSDEGEEQLGTAGAVRLALDLLDPIFLVTYGDSYLPFDYAGPLVSLAEHADCDGVMSVFKNEGKWDASNVIADDAWVLAYEKGTTDPRFDHIDYGAIALRKDIIAQLPARTRAALDPIQHSLAEKKRLRAFAAHDRFFEIGSPEGLATLALHLRKPS
ncbi:MAG: sugar phosphate nucleotidyltransferase [Polyangiaceae bacterium]